MVGILAAFVFVKENIGSLNTWTLMVAGILALEGIILGIKGNSGRNKEIVYLLYKCLNNAVILSRETPIMGKNEKIEHNCPKTSPFCVLIIRIAERRCFYVKDHRDSDINCDSGGDSVFSCIGRAS